MIFEDEIPEFPEIPDLSFLDDLGELLGGLGGLVELLEAFSVGIANAAGWVMNNWLTVILIIFGVVIGAWLANTLFAWLGFMIIKRQEGFGKTFTTIFENFIIGFFLAMIPIVGVLCVLVAQILNINRRHETGGWKASFIWFFAYVVPFAIFALVFIGAGGLTYIENFFTGLIPEGIF